MHFAFVFFCALWWLLAVAVVRNVRNARRLADLPDGPREDWPPVVTVMPACNEAETLGPALAVRLQDDYPTHRFVLVNDRSTDETGAVADAIDDRRLQVLHLTDLPDGWLGKVHALKKGAEADDAPWILFSDVDVHVEPGVLQRVIHLAEEGGFDLVAGMPTMRPAGLWMNGMHALFLRVLYAAFDTKRSENPRSKTAFGVGAFTLVRRSALDASRGFDAFRLSVADDLMLGRTIKAGGGRCTCANAAEVVSVDIYPRPMDFIRGAEKNAWAVSANFSLVRGLVGVLGFGMLEASPFLLTGMGPTIGWQVFGAATVAMGLLLSMFVMRANGRNPLHGLLYPLGSLLFLWAMLRGTILGFVRGGLIWRGTLYPNEVFRGWKPG